MPRDKHEAQAIGEEWGQEALEDLRKKLQPRQRRPLKAYVVGGFAFVPHPAARGVWVRTHPCVVQVACDYCKAKIGVPCEGREGVWLSSTHSMRRRAARGLPRIAEVQLQLTVR